MKKAIFTPEAPMAIGPYSQAVLCDNMLYTSGQIAINPATGTLEGDTIETQTEQVIKNLAAVLESAGMTFAQVVKTTCFLQNMADFAAFNDIYGQYFTSRPARSCVAVSQLPKKALVEIEVIAIL